MQPPNKKFLRFLQSWIINTVAVLLTVIFLRNHISYAESGAPALDQLKNLLVVSLLLGILNAFVRPILIVIALPLLILTLGLFTFIINALLLSLLTLLLPFFHVTRDGIHFSFLYAFFGALIISVISAILNTITGVHRIKIQRGGRRKWPRDSGRGGGSGGGPVIDV